MDDKCPRQVIFVAIPCCFSLGSGSSIPISTVFYVGKILKCDIWIAKQQDILFSKLFLETDEYRGEDAYYGDISSIRPAGEGELK